MYHFSQCPGQNSDVYKRQYIGILGGIGVGFPAQYGWQAVFNTFGALAIAAETYGLQGAVSLRVSQNVFEMCIRDSYRLY